MILQTHQQGEVRLLQKYSEITEGIKMDYEDASWIVERSYGSIKYGAYVENAIKCVVNFHPDFYDSIADKYNL